MSRSGYIEDWDDQWGLICYRGAVKSAIRGRRGQAFLREMLAALDALPEKRLITEELVIDGGNGGVIVGGDVLVDEFIGGTTFHDFGFGHSGARSRPPEVCKVGDVCALGAVALARKMDVNGIDPHAPEKVSAVFGIAEALAREIVYENDEGAIGYETPERRFARVRGWVAANLREAPGPDRSPGQGAHGQVGQSGADAERATEGSK